jgi:hypothetical protein
VDSVKSWLWRTSVTGAVLVIALGLAPLAYLFWLGSGDKLEPLSMPLPLARGEYASLFFTTSLDDDYQVEIYFLPFNRTQLDLDWKIVDARGAVMASGSYRDEHTGGNDVVLGHYRPKRGLNQRAIVNVHQGEAAPGSDVRLHIGLPERVLENSYAFVPAGLWAVVIGGAGVIGLIAALIGRSRRAASPNIPSMS